MAKLAPPPAKPVAPGNAEGWLEVEKQIGTPLPADFKDYISIYGAGQWTDFFGIMNPFYVWKHPKSSESWREWIGKRFEGYEDFQQKWPKDTAPFPLFPKNDGLLAFGYDDNGGTICWQTKGNPDSWRIVCLDGKLSEEYDVLDMSLTGFLDAVISEKVLPKTFPEDVFPVKKPAFRPYTNQ